MRSGILSIGSELLEGSVIDTNSAFIGGRLSMMGMTPDIIRMAGDDKTALSNAMMSMAQECDIVFSTGGLGPTFDDITAECLADMAKCPLELNEKAFKHMKERLDSLGVPVRDIHYHQARLPKDCLLFDNNYGTALGFGLEMENCLFICMPGVPSEMKPMFDEYVTPFLKKRFSIADIISRDIHFADMPESEIDEVIRRTVIPDSVKCIINAGKGEVVVKLRGKSETDINNTASILEKAFPENFIGGNGASPAQALYMLLKEKNKTISFAESCTGGLISKIITDISGASQVFYGGIVSYDNSVKENILGVSPKTLEKYGAVSAETAKEMALGAKRLSNTDYALSVTGIAGPDGGTPEKPVGTVYIGITDGYETAAVKHFFKGDREHIRIRSANQAFFNAVKFIKGRTD